ncbi:MAG TPA: HAMP domain-containing sensor histidine kinase [Candidatus Limnocylindrales bacterium]
MLETVVASIGNATAIPLVVLPDNTVDQRLDAILEAPASQKLMADLLAQANVEIALGLPTRDSTGKVSMVPATDGTFRAARTALPRVGQASDPITTTTGALPENVGRVNEYAIVVTLSDPYTFRASAVANVVGLLAIMGLISLGFAVVIAAIAARRFTAPLRRLTDASRAIAEGDYSRRVPADLALTGAAEIADLTRQFNTMAARLGESVEIIRRDRDRSRDFLADVSHELRTPIAAMRTFNELLREGADADPEARAEFLESSRQQLERLDWLAQNLLELSKLDSGLVLLDLRPDDLRACVESAVEQAEALAARRGIELTLDLPRSPVRIRHDPQRIGQVVANLVGNALKFTPRGGRVTIRAWSTLGGAQIEVTDTGVGIDAAELPRIFERFYRGSRAHEARGSGSGLGLAIVKSIVDMHVGRVAVESVIGGGTTFTVTLPADPRTAEPPEEGSVEPASAATAVDAPERPPAFAQPPTGVKVGRPADISDMADSSPSQAPSLNIPPSR